MPYTGDAENAMLTAFVKKEVPTIQPSFVGAFKAAAAVSFTAATTVLTKAAHGYSSKDLVELKAATIGASALVVGRMYYVKETATSTIELFDIYALTGTAITVEGATGVELVKLEEATGGAPAYARVASTWNAAAERKTKSAAEYEVNMAAAQVVDYVAYFSAASGAGTTLAVAKITKETFAAQGILKVKEGALDLAAAA
jgi:hypothetical protein